MYSTLLLSALFATSFAVPFAQTVTSGDWTPAAGSTVVCNKTTDYSIDGYQGIPLETLLPNACKKLIPCAYPTDQICTQATDHPLNEELTTTQPANILYKGNRKSGWGAKFTVIPPAQKPLTGIRWDKEDCEGYFRRILEKWAPDGCHTNTGMGIGSLTVGNDQSLKGTVFEITVVDGQ